MLIDYRKLTETVGKTLLAAGSAPEEATIVAEHLVLANLSGHDSHGVSILPTYLQNVRLGVLNPNRHVTLLKRDGNILVIDGDMGFGQVIAREATEQTIAVAKETGLALAERHNLSLYDATIAAAALHAGCDALFSEDMQHGMTLDGRLRVVDPFRKGR